MSLGRGMPMVAGVDEPAQRVPCYLVEWYGPELIKDQFRKALGTLSESAAAMTSEGTPVRLMMTLTVPSDEVVFGVIAADSSDVVEHACERAGVPAQRVTAAVDTYLDARAG